MKTIGFVDYYISEWHANNYPKWIREASKVVGEDFEVKYAWAEEYVSPVTGENTDEWCEKYGVTKCSTIKELSEKADYIIVLAPSNPEKHFSYAKEVFKCGKLTYIDKTFAPDYQTAAKIYDLANENKVKIFSTSALRYATEIESLTDVGAVITLGGGGNFNEYMIHQIELVVKILGAQAEAVKVEKQGINQYTANIAFFGGKQATMIYAPENPFIVISETLAGKTAYVTINSDFFKLLIEDILKFFISGIISFDVKQTLEVAKIREAVILGEERLGEWIKL